MRTQQLQRRRRRPNRLPRRMDPYRVPKGPQLPTINDVTDWISLAELNETNGDPFAGKVLGVRMPTESGTLNLTGVVAPRALVIDGTGCKIARVVVSIDTCPFVVYDARITSRGVAAAAISGIEAGLPNWDDPPMRMFESKKPNRLSAFVGCLFAAVDFERHVDPPAGLSIPGIIDRKVGPKWWLHAQCPRGWVFKGCTFHAAQEHILYPPWIDYLYVTECTMYATGGTMIQTVHRWGKPSKFGMRYYGNPAYPAHRGQVVIAHNRFIDQRIWAREASALTGAGHGYLDWWVVGNHSSGSDGFLALWFDENKGGVVSPAENNGALLSDCRVIIENVRREFGTMGIDAPTKVDWHDDIIGDPVTGYRIAGEDWPEEIGDKYHAHGRVVLDRNVVEGSSNHNRVQLMVSGAREIYCRNQQIHTHKPPIAFGAEGGSEFENGPIHIAGDLPPIVTWDGDRYIPLPLHA